VASCADVPTGYASSGIGLNVASGRNPSDPSAAVDAYNGRCALCSGADSLALRAVPEATTAGSGGRNLFTVLRQLRQDWLGNIRNDLLAGLVVALALIPEAIAFSIIAGVDPKVGLYASFCIAVVIAFAGGRPGMISAATGAMALVMVTLVKEHGLQYLLAATILTGVLQILAGLAAAREPDAVRLALRDHGLRQRLGDPDLHGPAAGDDRGAADLGGLRRAAAGLAIIYLLPLLTRAVPSPLVAHRGR
jgi:SulP family sulfate permease